MSGRRGTILLLRRFFFRACGRVWVHAGIFGGARRRERDRLRQRNVFREFAENLFRGLRLALQCVDLRERVFERGVAIALASISGVEDLFLSGERGLEAKLVVVRTKPCVEGERGDEQDDTKRDNFNGASSHFKVSRCVRIGKARREVVANSSAVSARARPAYGSRHVGDPPSFLADRAPTGVMVECSADERAWRRRWRAPISRRVRMATYLAVAAGALGGAGGRDTWTSADGTDSRPFATAVT